MAITFIYEFDSSFVIRLVEGCFSLLAYLMLLLSSQVNHQNRRELHLLKYAGIIGIIFVGIYMVLPTLVCTPPITGLCYTIGFLKRMIFYIPVLISLGILLLLFGKQNRETYGSFLYYSGLLWILTFLGYFFVHLVSSFDLWMFFFLGILGYFFVPAVLLMIVHGAKFNDTYFILAGVFYILSWFSSIVIPWFF